VSIPSSMVCRLHAAARCRYSEDCKFIHVCREILHTHLSQYVTPLIPELETRFSGNQMNQAIPPPPSFAAHQMQQHQMQHQLQPQFQPQMHQQQYQPQPQPHQHQQQQQQTVMVQQMADGTQVLLIPENSPQPYGLQMMPMYDPSMMYGAMPVMLSSPPNLSPQVSPPQQILLPTPQLLPARVNTVSPRPHSSPQPFSDFPFVADALPPSGGSKSSSKSQSPQTAESLGVPQGTAWLPWNVTEEICA